MYLVLQSGRLLARPITARGTRTERITALVVRCGGGGAVGAEQGPQRMSLDQVPSTTQPVALATCRHARLPSKGCAMLRQRKRGAGRRHANSGCPGSWKRRGNGRQVNDRRACSVTAAAWRGNDTGASAAAASRQREIVAGTVPNSRELLLGTDSRLPLARTAMAVERQRSSSPASVCRLASHRGHPCGAARGESTEATRPAGTPNSGVSTATG